MTVAIAREAEADLEQIADFIALDNPTSAIAFVQELIARCHELSAHPLRYAALEDYGGRLRRYPYQGYSIYYQVLKDDSIVIVHILHDAREHDRILVD